MSGTGSAASPGGEIRLKLFGRTDVGQIREHNEDNFLIADLTRKSRSLMEADREQLVGPSGTVFAVCDGMGGAAAGEVASKLAVDIIYENMLSGGPPPNRDELARRLVSTVEEAGLRIFNEARADRTRRGMGTTSTVAALLDSRLFLAQVGDSRAYLLRGDTLVQVTRDQSLVNQLIEAGQLTEEEAETFEHNNIILQALGTAETVQVDLTFVDLRKGDVLMMCSDGLSGMIRAEDIRSALVTYSEPLEICKVLTEKANQAGGHDNITVIVVKFDGEGLSSVTAEDEAVKYRKFGLPQSVGIQDPTVRPGGGAILTPAIESGPVSDEAERESRALRVGHTMVGMTSPLAATPGFDAVGLARSPSGRARPFDEPVDLPTSGLPPSVVGFIVVGAFLLVVAMGFWLLR
ncbi:MAG TPA: Stp1/IreP family PP2C-type Ser/Thr phosphatase [Polyangiaceae bacterium]|jgi:protein phosphatase|nr:Stp1/IreP family PP2C-type Ser/Thr phosphatase [Polyangiaceae bacterium]